MFEVLESVELLAVMIVIFLCLVAVDTVERFTGRPLEKSGEDD
ncbi:MULTISPECIES: hypothetical protein [Thermaerobacter]|uniref:Uncharacterized protein n=1 Tax=Thermaerobacter subterraneus DSM 13965 TaxID=867903 RepID=K6PNR0_9FIRM|nr:MULTISPECIES: hypothetical protein [Thermaerobacter]EKP94507.1 hypothetical protein ThesuDRAFT_02245 [Thermaerobacter subterraneus DSM 13965]